MRLSAGADSCAWENEYVELFLLEEADVGASYVAWLNDPEINRFLESRFTEHDELATRKFVVSCLQSENTLLLGIRSRALRRHVGNIKLGMIDRKHGLGEVGVLIGDRAAWNGGLASAAIRIMCRIAGQSLGLRKLTAGCYACNIGSQRAFEKAGFVVEGRRREHFLLDGVPEDLILMAHWLKNGGSRSVAAGISASQ
jgi:ribosomal-protein-alanine N-acetyltransferase